MLSRLPLIFTLVVWVGCAHRVHLSTQERPFNFQTDTLQFANQLVWEYYSDPDTGQMKHRRREPSPDYTHRCFVVARTAHQFFNHVRFAPELPHVREATYRELIKDTVNRNPRHIATAKNRIIIPGYANLREFSKAHEKAIKDFAGPSAQSYFQRGHWRMVMPFSRRHQRTTSEQLKKALAKNQSAVVHLVKFPQLSINHAVLIYAARQDGTKTRFSVYDPNHPEKPSELTYDSVTENFLLAANDYFNGGALNAYRIYHSIVF